MNDKYQIEMQKVIDELNEELKLVKTFEQFKTLENKMLDTGYGLYFEYQGITNKHRTAYAFTQVKIFDQYINKVEFLLDDGFSVKRIKISNLKNKLKVRG